jgi:single-stranded DNA-binding protein
MATNKIIVKGNIGRIEAINENSDKAFQTMSVCCNEYMGKDGEGNARYEDTWFDVVAFGGQGKRLASSGVKPGDFVEVEGRMSRRQNEKDGVKYDNWSIILDDFEILRRKPEA